MNFKKYNSIENSYREKYLNAIRVAGHGLESIWYHVQEKIHGANLSIYCDGKNVQFASKDQILDDRAFYGLESIAQELAMNALNMWHMIMQRDDAPELTGFILYGELFGGNYPHPDVQRNNDACQIQKGVFYSPNTEFIAFDMYVTTFDDPIGGECGNLVGTTLVNDLCDSAGFMRAKSLMMGTLDECLEYPNDNLSLIAEQLGYPRIEDNIMEGVVIKPDLPCYLPNGKRVCIKNKNAKFTERTKNRVRKPKEPLAPHIEALITTGLCYVNENRYNNVLSHFGEVDYSDSSNIGKLIPMLLRDAMQDFSKENDELLGELTKAEKQVVQKAVTNACKNLVLKSF